MPSDRAPLGSDGQPIFKFGFVMTTSSLLFSDGKNRRGRVIDIKPDKNDNGNSDITVSFDVDGEEVVKTVKSTDLRASVAPKAWLGKELKGHGDIGEIVAWQTKKGIGVGVVSNVPFGHRKNKSAFYAIDLETGKEKINLSPDGTWHLDEADLTPEQLAAYEVSGLRDREATGPVA